MRTIEDEFNRLRAEFLEMPGLRLRPEQVQRLCGIDPTMCRLMLDWLVDEQFLRVMTDGTYARVTEGDASRPRLAKAVRS